MTGYQKHTLLIGVLIIVALVAIVALVLMGPDPSIRFNIRTATWLAEQGNNALTLTAAS